MTIKSDSKSSFIRRPSSKDGRTETEFRDQVASYVEDVVDPYAQEIQSVAAQTADIAGALADPESGLVSLKDQVDEINQDIADLADEIQTVGEGLERTIGEEISSVRESHSEAMIEMNSFVNSMADDLAEGILRLLEREDLTMEVLRSATFEIDPNAGTAVIRCVEDLKTEHGYRLSNAEANINAQSATIALKASRSELDEMAGALISGSQPVLQYLFQDSAQGWTASGATLTTSSDYVEMDCSASGSYIQIEGISLVGENAPIFSLHFKQSAGDGWGGKVRWKTGSHGYSDAYEVALLGTTRDSFRVFQAGFNNESDWMDSTITGVRLYLGESAADEFQIKEISFGVSLLQQLLFAGIEARLSSAELWIDGANATIQSIAQQVVIDGDYATNTEVSSAISAAEGTITNSILELHINPMGIRTQSLEDRMDVAEGKISQTISDIEGNFSDPVTAEALLHNLVFQDGQIEIEGQKLAFAQQELQAQVQDGLNAEANQRTLLATQIDSSLAGLEDTLRTHSTDITALAEDGEVLHARVDDTTATIEELRSAQVQGDLSEAILQTLVGVESVSKNGETALAVAKEELRLETENGEHALAEQITLLGAQTEEAIAGAKREVLTEVDGSYAKATDVNTLSTTVNDNFAAVQTAMGVELSEVTEPLSWWGVQTDANGTVLGAIKLTSDGATGTSSFKVQADKFKVVHPSTGEEVLLTDTSTGETYLRSALIGEASIGGSQLVDGCISTNHLAAGSVSTSALAADAVTASKIAANAVSTEQLAANSVTASKIAAGAILAELAVIDTAYIENAHIKNLTVDKGKLAAGITQGYHMKSILMTSEYSDILYVSDEYLSSGGRVLLMAMANAKAIPDSSGRGSGYVYVQYSYQYPGGSWSDWKYSGQHLVDLLQEDAGHYVSSSDSYLFTGNAKWRFRLFKNAYFGSVTVRLHSLSAIVFHK